MAIAKLSVANFKSFDEVEVSLGDFTVLVGANGSGKSNFISIFRFLRDITRFGLENAISLQGGSEFVRNVSLGATKPLEIEITSEDRMRVPRGSRRGAVAITTERTVYRFALTFHKRGPGYTISDDALVQDWTISRRTPGAEPVELGRGVLTTRNERGRISSDIQVPDELADLAEDILPVYYRKERGARGSLLLEQPFLGFAPALWSRDLEETAIYDIDPKLPKKAVPVTGKLELEEDGSNLAIVLNNVLSKRGTKTQLVNLMSDLLPFVDNIGIEKFADTSLLFKVMERYGPRKYFPASLISDGTINITALILALFFESSNRLTIIEEPERNIHPHLISKIVGYMLESVSSRKQLIVSTHNPDLVANAPLESILVLQRDSNGFTTFSRPADSKRVRAFLESELGVKSLFTQDLLRL
jgi:predicted ATPase